MSEYLECGHPAGCLKKLPWRQELGKLGFPTHGCAACERGGWVLGSEGLPPEVALLEGAVSWPAIGPIPARRLVYRGNHTLNIWQLSDSGGSLQVDAAAGVGHVYAWRYWPDAPPEQG